MCPNAPGPVGEPGELGERGAKGVTGPTGETGELGLKRGFVDKLAYRIQVVAQRKLCNSNFISRQKRNRPTKPAKNKAHKSTHRRQ